MSLPTSETVPFPEDELPPARRRRQRRLVLPDRQDDRARALDDLGLRLTPGLDFFLSALLSGFLFGLSLLFGSPALGVLAALLAPFMAPALGLGLAAAAGSFSFLLLSLGWLLSAGAIYFLTGTLAGIAARLLPAAGQAAQAAQHLALDWAGLLLLSVGAVVTTALLARSPRQKPLVSSVALAYTLFLPLGAAGFALTAGAPSTWSGGLLVFAAHLVWTALCVTLTLAGLGLAPRDGRGYLLAGAYLGICLLALAAALLGPLLLPAPAQAAENGAAVAAAAAATQTAQAQPVPAVTAEDGATAAVPTASPTAAPSQTATLPAVGRTAPTATGDPNGAALPKTKPTLTLTITPTRTLVPSATATITVTPQATPVWARINAKGGDGAFIRKEPKYTGEIVVALLNGVIVEVLPDVVIEDGATWVKVIAAGGQEGWIVRSLLATATPAPGW